MPKCLLSGKEIAQGETIIEPIKHLDPNPGGFIAVASLKAAYSNMTVVEELRKEVRDLKRKLGEE